MKKFTVLFFAGLLLLAFGATASAQGPKLEFRASGWIDAQTIISENVPAYNGGAGLYATTPADYAGSPFGGIGRGSDGFNRTRSNWESRAHLKFDAVMGPNLSGTIYFEIDAQRWGNIKTSSFTSGPGNGREANTFGVWNTDRVAVEVKNIYIDFGLPYFGIPVPITMRVGAQPIGVRPGIFLGADGMGVTGGIKIDPVLIAPIYAKVLEGNDWQDDDIDVWGLHANVKLGTFTVGAYGMYFRMNSYPLFVTSTVGTLTAALQPSYPGSNKSHIWWLGAYADGKAGPVNLNFDIVYDNGWVKHTPNAIAPHVKYEGLAVRGKVDYPWEKFNFGGVGMYATGSDANKTSTNGLPGTLTANGTVTRKVSGYVVPPGSEQGPACGESIVVYSMEGAATGGYGYAERATYSGLGPGAFGGTWFAKLYGSVKATPWWKITLQGLYIGDTTKHGNTLGNAVKRGTVILRDDKDIGWEVNLINEFQIYKNLRFFTGFGYLFAGDALDIRKNLTTTNISPKDPWAFRTRLMYTF